MSCFSFSEGNNGIKLIIDPNLVEEDLRAKISYIALVQTKEPSLRIPPCPNNRHYGVRVVLRAARDKHVFLHWGCPENNRLGIEDVTGTRHTELYEPGYGKQVTRDVTVFQLRDTVMAADRAADRGNDCLSVAEAMYRAATGLGAVETIAAAPESDGVMRLSDVDTTTLIGEMNTRTQDEAERLLEERGGFDPVM